MKPAPFEYLRPGTLEEALVALDHDDAKIIAGGQTLVPMMNFRLVAPERLVDINGIAELSRINETEGGIRIGALVRHAQAARDPLLKNAFPVVADAMRHVAHLAVRNRGTIGGSLCHADPSAEWPLLISLLDGGIEIAGGSGTRTCTPGEFFFAPLMTDLADDEVLTGVVLPRLPAGTGMAFDEIAQRAGDFAVVACGATVEMGGDRIVSARLAFGGLSDVPVRMADVEQAMAGATVADIAGAVAGCADGLEPNEDMHAAADYRRSLAPVLARRVLTAAAGRAGGRE
ncbi:carbon-monoxide dehydrogenase medium subunit [Roseovarius azorensis]|uniref:Carbon-monoxide dehydrogenase medium subunit n=1 Tax=Roseovarius azorensis TaxID=1287727 RepID=A0A1H7XEA6_9RHOB|nr:xanthine dehydrogenase family protein subunit M [Roseovarius azorensis]SEM32061.1 carbon-monoxide dehydrogenase medium subunit [Roseovarius azorensis]